MKNIIIADDHSLIREGFEQVIQRYLPEAVIRKAKNKTELWTILKNEPAEVLFQDIKFGKHDARDFIKELKEAFPALKIVVLSTFTDELTVNAVIKQGADGYLSKTDDSKALQEVFDKLQKGSVYLSPDLKNTGIHKVPHQSVFLTEREKETLSHILNGKTTRETAALMFLSEKTIEIHRSNLLLKFDVNNVAALVKKALFEGYS